MLQRKLNIFISHPSEFLTNCQPHGDGLCAFEFITRLAARGHTLHVAVPKMDIQGELPPGVQLYPAAVWTPFSTLNALEYMVKVRQIFDEVQRQQPIDIIHQLNPVNPGLSVGLLNTRVPLVLGLFVPNWAADSEPVMHQTSPLGAISYAMTEPLVQWCDRRQQTRATALLLSTPAALTRVYNPGANSSKVHILPYGIDRTQFFPAPPGERSSEPPSILYLASLNRRKGIFTLLDAFEAVVAALPTCQLIIAGSGIELSAIEERILTMKSRSQITLLGRVAREQVPALMRNCTVYCLPSLGEPFGMSALEAMACGTPVVATDAGGLKYLVTHEGGRKVPPGDASALSVALIEVMSSPRLQQQMQQHNLSLVEKLYDWEQVITRLESIYDQSIAVCR